MVPVIGVTSPSFSMRIMLVLLVLLLFLGASCPACFFCFCVGCCLGLDAWLSCYALTVGGHAISLIFFDIYLARTTWPSSCVWPKDKKTVFEQSVIWECSALSKAIFADNIRYASFEDNVRGAVCAQSLVTDFTQALSLPFFGYLVSYLAVSGDYVILVTQSWTTALVRQSLVKPFTCAG